MNTPQPEFMPQAFEFRAHCHSSPEERISTETSQRRPVESKLLGSEPIRPNQTVVIFDGDDTLWETQILYERAKQQFFERMAQLGFPYDQVKAQLDSTDRANVAVLGFSKRRFPQSMYDTYHSLCIERGLPFDQAAASHFRSIAESVFERTPRLFAGTVEALAELRSRGISLVLATKGDPEVQEKRIASVGLRRWFDRVFILPDKGVSEFQHIVAECRIEKRFGWSVGNSLKADIKPALVVGLSAIWILNPGWSYELDEAGGHKRLFRVTSIKDVPAIIASTGR